MLQSPTSKKKIYKHIRISELRVPSTRNRASHPTTHVKQGTPKAGKVTITRGRTKEKGRGGRVERARSRRGKIPLSFPGISLSASLFFSEGPNILSSFHSFLPFLYDPCSLFWPCAIVLRSLSVIAFTEDADFASETRAKQRTKTSITWRL